MLFNSLFFFLQERESLKAILSSYESEATISYSVVGQERVHRLEAQVELYRQEVDRLNAELQEACNTGTSPASAATVSSQVHLGQMVYMYIRPICFRSHDSLIRF